MEIVESKKNDILILEIHGKLDSNTSTPLEQKLIAEIDGGTLKIVIECSKMDYISSAGLRVLLVGAKKLKNANGKIILCSLQDYIKEVFEIAGFTAIFPIYPDLSAALNQL
ncbi:MAG: STAS domain-containing protein [Ignavibacteriales bacterium]|nr:STAS domain-containing protein [Ignavibacteriales bacterium]